MVIHVSPRDELLFQRLVMRFPAIPPDDLEKALDNAIRLAKPRSSNSFVLMVAAMLLEDHPCVSIRRNRRKSFPFAFWLGMTIVIYLAMAWMH
jgi:hypothetical protein